MEKKAPAGPPPMTTTVPFSSKGIRVWLTWLLIETLGFNPRMSI
jgi:hypothetical protein